MKKLTVILGLVLVMCLLVPVSCAAPPPPSMPAPTPAETILTPTPTPTYTLNVSVSPSGAGSVSPPGGKYESGLQVTLTATPASGYTFDYWDGAASGSSHTVTIIMDSNKSTTAHFKAVETPPAPTPTPTPTPTPAPTPTPLTLNQFLEDNFGTLETSLGPTSFKFDIHENRSILILYDYWIQVEYDSGFFYDLKYSIDVTTEMNRTVCKELKAHQEKLARAVMAFMPAKKFYGGYYDSWYRYPTLKVDLITRHYYSWVNYTPASVALLDYDETTVSSFQWYSLIDDELTR